jgi:hypothetical protein
MTLEAEELREIFHYDPETGVITRKKNFRKYRDRIGKVCTWKVSFGHLAVSHKRKSILAHRLAVLLMTGDWPAEFVDHVNGDPADNRWCNLRQCSRAENTRHQKVHKRSATGHRGVHYVKRYDAWRAVICVNRKLIYLGQFGRIEDAIAARAAASLKYHGEFSGRLSKGEEHASR